MGEQVKEIKIRAGVMFSKQQDKKSRFSSKKRAPRYCVLTKSGQLKLYRAQNEPVRFFSSLHKNDLFLPFLFCENIF